jgi:transcriptional regulator with XRE-family HTH domain
MDLPLKLKLLRQTRSLSQKDLARIARVGEKTLSSFETGQRITSLKVVQLERIVTACGTTLVEFLLWDPQAELLAMPVAVAPAPEPALEPPTLIRRTLQPVDPLRRFQRDDPMARGSQSSLSRVVM